MDEKEPFSTIPCPRCRKDNLIDAELCDDCGTSLEALNRYKPPHGIVKGTTGTGLASAITYLPIPSGLLAAIVGPIVGVIILMLSTLLITLIDHRNLTAAGWQMGPFLRPRNLVPLLYLDRRQFYMGLGTALASRWVLSMMAGLVLFFMLIGGAAIGGFLSTLY